ncbi:hypothetical protein E2320_019843 [Naja naja]|nr:hypothetical protein E2320_019843 [Naja naja]
MASISVMGRGFMVFQLNETNYLSWSVKMEIYLQKEEFPDDGDQRRNEKALANIILHLENSQLIHVRSLQTAKECWEALHSVYAGETVGSKVLLTRTLY